MSHGKNERLLIKIQIPYSSNHAEGNRPFLRFVYAGIDMLEGISLNNKPFIHGPVINGPEVTHIIRTGIRTDTGSFEPAFIGYHLIGIQFIQWDIAPVSPKPLKAVQGILIGAGCAYLTYLPQFYQQFFSI